MRAFDSSPRTASSSAAHSQPPRRRWLQFSLRTLLLLVTLACIAAWVGTWLQEHYREGLREKEAIAWVEGLGGVVEYDDEASERDWRRQWLGEWYPPIVRGIDLSNPVEYYSIGVFAPTEEPGDLVPLVVLGQLQRLDLSNTVVSDLGPLAELSELQQLKLVNCTRVTDFSPLTGLENLHVLDLSLICEYELQSEWQYILRCPDFIPLAGMENLRELRPAYCYDIDTELLAGLEDLRVLDLTCAATLEPTDSGYIGHSPNLLPLAGLKRLEVLNLGGCLVDDFTPLAGLVNLEVLDLDNAEASDLAPLAGLEKLRELNLDDCQNLTDIGPLRELTNLQHLSLRNLDINDFSVLAELKSLRVLRLYNTPFADATLLGGLTNLQELSLSRTRVSDLTPLENMQNLRELTIRNLRVSPEAIPSLTEALPNCAIHN